MTSWNRLVLQLGLGAALVACLVRTGLVSGLNGDREQMPELQRALDAEEQRRDRLDRLQGALQKRVAGKHEITQSLLAGKVSLLEAARQFRALNESVDPPNVDPLAAPGTSADERACRQVIHWADAEFRHQSPNGDRSLVERLEAEFQRRRREGTLHTEE